MFPRDARRVLMSETGTEASAAGSSIADFELGEELFGAAIARALRAPVAARVALFAELVAEVSAVTHEPGSGRRPWTCTVHTGIDGSRIFRGGLGGSLVIDPQGRLWRARSYEDFETEYEITPVSCEIRSLTPSYKEMREYLPRLVATE